MKLPEKCHCGKPMHLSAGQKLLLKSNADNWGEYKPVKILGGNTYKVPTYYIILHRLRGAEIPKLGFEELK